MAQKSASHWLRAVEVSRAQALSLQVYHLVRDAIVSGQLQPHDGISEPEIASLLSISRTPIREALLRLQREGLVDIRPQAGTSVTPVDWDRVEEGMIVREALELRAIEAAIPDLSGTAIQSLTGATDRMETANSSSNLDAFLAADDAFDDVILQASGYRHIPIIIEEINGHLDRVRSMSDQTPYRMPQAIDEHRDVLSAIKTGKPMAGVDAMRRHLQSSWSILRKIGETAGLVA
jgi:DNA-binding GntR family transcriptional regulator